MSDLEQIINGETPAGAPEAAPEPTPEAQEVAPEPVEAQPEPKPAEPQEQMVPVKVVADLRQEIRELRQAQQPAVKPPEFIDPEGAQFLQSQMQMMQANMIAQQSEYTARIRHGSDAVDEAMKAAEAAGMVDQFRGRQDPWGDLTKWHQGQKVQAEVGDDPAAYKAKLEAELRAKIQAEMVANEAQRRAASPAPSMANATGSAGGGPVSTWNGPTPLEDAFKG